MINFENELNYNVNLELEDIAENIIEKSLDILKFPYQYDIDLLITDSENIREINKNFRNIDKTTDVLSFPMNEWSEIGKYDEENLVINPDTESVMLGDIVINYDKVLLQSKEYGHSEKREYAFLIIHSILHLLGYDHMNEEDEQVMFTIQREILDKIGINRYV